MKIKDTKTNEILDCYPNDHGVYIFYKVKTNRNINPKAKKRKADEVLILGMPHKAFKSALEKGEFKIIGGE